MDTIKLKQSSKGPRPNFFDDPAVDRLVAIITALAGEVSVLHDQIDTIARVLAQKKVVTAEDLDGFAPDGTVAAEREAWREIFLENIFRIVHQERESAQEDRVAYDQVVDDVTKA